MSGGEYAPKDSRDVTLHPTEPGKPSGWRETGPDGDAAEDKMAPDDMRDVTGSKPAGSAPGEDSGWRQAAAADDKAGDPKGRTRSDDPGAANPDVAPATTPPTGVPQPAEPYSAEEAAAARRASSSETAEMAALESEERRRD